MFCIYQVLKIFCLNVHTHLYNVYTEKKDKLNEFGNIIPISEIIPLKKKIIITITKKEKIIIKKKQAPKSFYF